MRARVGELDLRLKNLCFFFDDELNDEYVKNNKI